MAIHRIILTLVSLVFFGNTLKSAQRHELLPTQANNATGIIIWINDTDIPITINKKKLSAHQTTTIPLSTKPGSSEFNIVNQKNSNNFITVKFVQENNRLRVVQFTDEGSESKQLGHLGAENEITITIHGTHQIDAISATKTIKQKKYPKAIHSMPKME